MEAAGHGGQVLITDAVRTAAAVMDVTDLGVRQLRDVAEPLRLFKLGVEVFAPLRVVDLRLSNLPIRATRLIGREVEVGRVRGLLDESRLVTVTAVGGSGKTRLAIAVGEAELTHCRDGLWFVDLTAAATGADVPSAIAMGLGMNLVVGDPTGQILTFLGDKQALVILDNCEHLIDDCASFVDAFLATSSPARILATSREALDIDGERTVVLGSLATDTADSPGVRLFVGSNPGHRGIRTSSRPPAQRLRRVHGRDLRPLSSRQPTRSQGRDPRTPRAPRRTHPPRLGVTRARVVKSSRAPGGRVPAESVRSVAFTTVPYTVYSKRPSDPI